MTVAVEIGTFHQREAEQVRRCPSHYAADWEVLEREPGDYPVRITFEGGYLIPMPTWVLVGIPATRVDGATYSGFGGVNFASRELSKGERVTDTIQTYPFTLKGMIEAGKLTLKPEFAWLLEDHTSGPRTWDEVRRLSGEIGPNVPCSLGDHSGCWHGLESGQASLSQS